MDERIIKSKKNYANAIYQNAMVGVQSIRDIIDKTDNINLKRELDREVRLFNQVADDVKRYAKNNAIEISENNFFEKSRLWLSINMSTMMDKSPRKIAELMLLGTVMGLITCYKDKNDHKGVDAELDIILANLEKIEDDNYLKLKTFLKDLK